MKRLRPSPTPAYRERRRAREIAAVQAQMRAWHDAAEAELLGRHADFFARVFRGGSPLTDASAARH